MTYMYIYVSYICTSHVRSGKNEYIYICMTYIYMSLLYVCHHADICVPSLIDVAACTHTHTRTHTCTHTCTRTRISIHIHVHTRTRTRTRTHMRARAHTPTHTLYHTGLLCTPIRLKIKKTQVHNA